jgi:ribonuclease D
MPIITDTETLADFCQRVGRSSYVTVDTEFMRENTFWPHLCVVQVAGEDDASVIDALAEGIDLTPLYELMADTRVLKVFHAARQDLEIFWNAMQASPTPLPTPLFDTQVAAMVCGFGESAGYETLVRQLAGKQIDKSSRFTDWSHRPLSEKQIAYALADVTHLRPVYEKLANMLAKNGRTAWLDEEMAILTEPRTYAQPSEEAWKRIKGKPTNRRALAVLMQIAAWRDREAKRRNIPRSRVLRDEALVEIAHHAPQTVDDLARVRGMGRRMAEGQSGAELLDAVAAGTAIPDKDLPVIERPDALPRGLGPITDLLKVLLKAKCEENQVATKLIATADDVEKIAAFGEKADVAALHGWRRAVFGEDALALRGGKLALVVAKGNVELVEFEDDG